MQTKLLEENETSIFNRHPKKTIIIIFLIFTFLLLILLEWYFSTQKMSRLSLISMRSVRLRELSLKKESFTRPDETQISVSDNLEKKEYRIATDEDGFIVPSM